MKIALNIIIGILILTIWSDIEKNIENPELHYSNSIIAFSGILFFGFFRIYHKEFIQFLTTKN